MLALGRKEGESVIIGGNIIVTISSIKSSNQVILAIKAPETVSIVREELLEEIDMQPPNSSDGRQR